MRAPESHTRGHLLMGRIALALLAFALLAFALKAIVHPEVRLRYTPIVVIHAASMIAWLTLLASQSFLAARFRLSAHRQAMLIATLALMTPAYARLVQVAGLPDPVAIAMQVPITVMVAAGYDWALHGRVTRPTLIMLSYSLGVVAVMVGVLALWFL